MRFCSSLSSTFRVMYWNWSGKRGRTAKASFASRMHNLRFSGVVDQQAKDKGRAKSDGHVSDAEGLEGFEGLGCLERPEVEMGQDLLAASAHVVAGSGGEWA